MLCGCTLQNYILFHLGLWALFHATFPFVFVFITCLLLLLCLLFPTLLPLCSFCMPPFCNLPAAAGSSVLEVGAVYCLMYLLALFVPSSGVRL
jgi:hypothetical protein